MYSQTIWLKRLHEASIGDNILLMRKGKPIHDDFNRLLDIWNSAYTGEDNEEFRKALSDANYDYLTLDEVTQRGKFMPESFVFTLEDDPSDRAYYTEDGDGLHYIFMGNILAGGKEEEEEEYDEEIEDEEIEDAESFIKFYAGFEDIIVNISRAPK